MGIFEPATHQETFYKISKVLKKSGLPSKECVAVLIHYIVVFTLNNTANTKDECSKSLIEAINAAFNLIEKVE